MDHKKMNEDMLNVVKSDEAKEVFEESIKNLDSKAFTDEGVIKSYKIDEGSIEHNPMGGIMVTLFANNDKTLEISFTLGKNSDGHLTDDGGSNSAKLEKLLQQTKKGSN